MKISKLFNMAKITIALILITLLVTTGSKLLSKLYLTKKTETEHFILLWTKDEARFFNCLPTALEENYKRISKDLNSTVSGKIIIKLYDNSWVYNLSIGNPFPWPKIRASGNADYQRKMIDVLLPPLNDAVYQEKNVLQLFCMTGIGHEIAHILISEINPQFIRGWWHEGIAEYEHLIPLKDHDEFKELIESTERAIKKKVTTGNIPTFEELSVRNFNKFVDINGYEFSTEFVNFAVSNFGPEVIPRMAKYPGDYDRVFNASKEEVWQYWMEYLSAKYSMPATFILPLSEDIYQTLRRDALAFIPDIERKRKK